MIKLLLAIGKIVLMILKLLLKFWPLAILIAFYIWKVKKYKRPDYKLIYLIGKKSAGKSTIIQKLILQHEKEGWNVYSTNREFTHCRYIPFECLGKMALPENSVLFWDETSMHAYNRNFKTFDQSIREWLVYQRHYGNKVYLCSQSYNIDKSLRDLVDNLYIVTSPIPLFTIQREVYRKIVLTAPSGEDGQSSISEQLYFRTFGGRKIIYQPKYYKYFDSFSKLDDLPILQVDQDPEDLLPEVAPPKVQRISLTTKKEVLS